MKNEIRLRKHDLWVKVERINLVKETKTGKKKKKKKETKSEYNCHPVQCNKDGEMVIICSLLPAVEWVVENGFICKEKKKINLLFYWQNPGEGCL